MRRRDGAADPKGGAEQPKGEGLARREPPPPSPARRLLAPDEGQYIHTMTRITRVALRQSGGLAEQRVWSRLRGAGVEGFKLRRQHDTRSTSPVCR